MNKVKNIGVIFGSRSCEHEVSIISALQLINSIDKEKYCTYPVYIDKTGSWYTGEVLSNIKTYENFDADIKGVHKVYLDTTPGSGALIEHINSKSIFAGMKEIVFANIDCFIIVMHGMNGEDGTLQGMLELANIPYTSCGIASSAIGMDKVIMKNFFRGAGFPVLEDVWFTRYKWQKDKNLSLKTIKEKFEYPVFVKPANLGSSIGVSRAENDDELEEALELAFSFDRKVLIERAIDSPLELNCSVLGDSRGAEYSPIEMPVTGGDVLGFMEKYLNSEGSSKGMASLKRIIPAPIEEKLYKEIQELSLNIFSMLDCKGVVRIDYMFDTKYNKYYITEINTIPGSMSFYLWDNAGMSYKKLIDKLIDCAVFANREKNINSYAYTSNILQSNISGTKGGLKNGKN